jgi:hypothetical protein
MWGKCVSTVTCCIPAPFTVWWNLIQEVLNPNCISTWKCTTQLPFQGNLNELSCLSQPTWIESQNVLGICWSSVDYSMLLSLPLTVFILNKVQPAIVVPAPQTSSYRLTLFIVSASCSFCSIMSLSKQSYCMPNASKLHDMDMIICACIVCKGKCTAVDYRGNKV